MNEKEIIFMGILILGLGMWGSLIDVVDPVVMLILLIIGGWSYYQSKNGLN